MTTSPSSAESVNADDHLNAASTDLSNPHDLLQALLKLRKTVFTEGRAMFEEWCPLIQRRPFLLSAVNMAHYLSLRRRDLRDIQNALTPWGLSSLGRAEGRVLSNLDAVIATLAQICDYTGDDIPRRPRLARFERGHRILGHETEGVFGAEPKSRRVRIMVTLPSEAAEDYALVRDLIKHGMNCARINCAHDDESAWGAMIDNVRRAKRELRVKWPVKVAMDLGGPKSRTADLTQPDKHRLKVGDTLLLTREKPKKSKQYPIQVRCTLTDVFGQLYLGADIWFDDGKIGTKVSEIVPEGVVLIVTHARTKGERLKEDKGVNFPGTNLALTPLTDKDRHDLDFVVKYADIINYSFVQRPEDIDLLHEELRSRMDDIRRVALVAKIETALAVQNLPQIIVHAASVQPFGVMIARGDLAVEIGYQRLAEIQEEILWLCEAAHIPVIWATQVLESLAKEGRPSRAEMTDAAMSERAECVMLNKGPYIVDAVQALDDVLKRMSGHQSKKTAKLRALRSW